MGSNRKKSSIVDKKYIYYYKFHQHKTHQRYLNQILVLVFVNLLQLIIANPVFVNNPSLAHFQSGRNIRHLPCIVRKSGLSGVCMFAIDCIKSNGTHLGTCIDRFYFGSCCQMKDDSLLLPEDISDNSIDQNTISHFQHESTTVIPTAGLLKVTTPIYNAGSTLGLLTRDDPLETTKIPYVQISTITPAQKLDTATTKFSNNKLTSVQTYGNLSTMTTTTKSQETITKIPILLTTTMQTTEVPKIKPTNSPIKISTLQSIQTETIIPTAETTISHSTSHNTKRPTKWPTTNKTTKPQKRNTTTARPITIRNPNPTTITTRRPIKTTTQHTRPQIVTTTRRVTTQKRPSSTSKRPTTQPTTRPKPSKRPITTIPPTSSSLSSSSSSPSVSHRRNTTTKIDIPITTSKYPTKLPTIIKIETRKNITTSGSKVTAGTTTPYPQATKAPRPRPKPTSNIVRVPPSTIKVQIEEKESIITTPKPIQKTTTKSTTTTSTTGSIKPPKTTSKPLETSKEPTTTATTLKKPTTIKITVAATTTPQAENVTITTTTTIPVPSILISTTMKPGLVTWTNLDELKNTTNSKINETLDEQWIPLKPDWVPLPTISPEDNIKAENFTTTPSTVIIPSSTTEGIDIIKQPSIINMTTQKVPEQDATTMKTPPPLFFDFTTNLPILNISTSDGYVFETTEGYPSNMTEFPPPHPYNTTIQISNATNMPHPSFEGIDYKQICGKRMFPEPRIVGGSNAAFGRWPWQISLRQWRTSTYLHKCGAALLNENWAITAAHCVDNVPPSDLLLRLGEYDLAEEEEPYGYQERRVQIVASHPQFDPRTFEYDLALLRFYEPVNFQPNIIPVCVPDSDAEFIGETAYVTGWGRLFEDGPLPSVLQEVSVPVINNTICETMYRSAGYIEHIPHIFICAGWKKGGYDSCEGDSGGPMVLQRDDRRFLLAGVISWGIGCAEPNQPGVYTRISEFRDWINQILQF